MKKEDIILGLLVISILIICFITLASAEVNETEGNNETISFASNESNDTEVSNSNGVVNDTEANNETNETEIEYINEELELPNAGITPDSALYGVDVFVDNARATLTPGALGKAKVRLDIVEERMAEMEEMAVKNKTTEAKKAELEGRKQIEKFESSVEKIKKKDAPELNEHIRTHADTLEILKQRLGDSDWAEAITDSIMLLEELENIIVNIPEDLGPESIFIISSICKGAGAETVAECQEMISSGALTAQVRIVPEGKIDPHNCSGSWADFRTKTKYCCVDSEGIYLPEVDNILDYYYRKGTVEYKIINLKTEEIEEGIETDSCDGDTLTEWLCPSVLNMKTRNERYSEEYDCPNGCEDGACINCNFDSVCDENEDCSCSDCEGKNNGCRHSYFVCRNGECVEKEFEGECIDSDGGMDYFVKGSVTGKSSTTNFTRFSTDDCDDSRLVEFFCGDNEEINITMYLCPNGCEDGRCIQE